MRSKLEYPIVQIPVDGGLWDVHGDPVQSAGMAANFCTVRIRRPRDTAFVMAPSFGAILFGLAFVGFGLVILGLVVRSLLDGIVAGLPDEFWPAVGAVAGTCLGVFLGVMCIVMSLTVMTQTTGFDRAAGTMKRSTLFRTQSELPLEDIVAVQCLYASRTSGKGGSYDVLQINLVVASGDQPRLCLNSNPNEAWTRETATGLAQFLGVHLVDQIAQTKAVYEANRFKWW